jgi:hypothetical protein
LFRPLKLIEGGDGQMEWKLASDKAIQPRSAGSLH